MAAAGKTCDEISFQEGDGATRGGVKEGLRRNDARGGVLLLLLLLLLCWWDGKDDGDDDKGKADCEEDNCGD